MRRSGSGLLLLGVLALSGWGASGALAASAAQSAAPVAPTGEASVTGSTTAVFSGTVNPDGLPTSAHFEYGLDARYREPGSTGIIYDQSTPDQSVGSDFSLHQVSASVSGLIPNAIYHVRLVATNSAGTSYGLDQEYTTAEDPAPPPPVEGKSANISPVSGITFVTLPQGVVPLTEPRQIRVGTRVDATNGRVRLTTARNKHGATETANFYAGGFIVTQRRGNALTTLTLVGSLSGCAHAATAGPVATIASGHPGRKLWGSGKGSYSTKGSTASATVQGTIWLTEDTCRGTFIKVTLHTVLVRDFVRHKTILLHAGQSYLASRKP